MAIEVRSKGITWYRTPVDKSLVHELTEKSDAKGWIRTGSFFCIYLLIGLGVVHFFSVRMWIPAIVLGYLFSLYSNFMTIAAAIHELSHGTVFRSKKVNEFFYHFFCLLTWNNPVHFRASHALHHQYTLHTDLDKEVIRMPVKKMMNWLNYVQWTFFDFHL